MQRKPTLTRPCYFSAQDFYEQGEILFRQKDSQELKKHQEAFSLKEKGITRGQRPNESQKAVIIYMRKSVGEIASKMWPVV